jgi:UDP-N-acetylmuramate--alanine ligase
MRAVAGRNATIETFGFSGSVNWKAEIIGSDKACPRFRVLRDGKALVEMRMSVPGRHNIANALAAMAICFHCGVQPDIIAEKLGEFRGAYRRLTERGCVAGVTVVDDYGHHPTEIQATLKAAREFYNPENMFVVFQPHQHSRTRFLLNDFARSFTQADVVIVPEIYFVRDSEQERDLIAARDLVERIHCNGGDARYEKDFDKIAAQLCREVRPGDLVITMGAGDVWKTAESLLTCLAATRGDATDIALAGDSQEY